MCGIAGIVSLDGSQLSDREIAAVEKMTSLLAHRGPDDSGVHIAPSHLAAFGHRRLSIIDLSSHGHQPYQCCNSTLVFNGEILNYEALAKRYDLGNEPSDTVVLSKLLDAKGLAVLPELRGFFAFAHWDDKKSQLLIARDAIGKKPFHYSFSKGRLIFASELRAIVASGLVDFRINKETLHLYLSHYSVPGPHSIVTNVKTLLPGSTLRVSGGVVSTDRWWRLQEHSPIKATRNEIISTVRELFLSSTSARLISDAPLGLFHSGGIDSNAVLAAASEVSTSKLATFNVRFGAHDNEEAEVARISAEHFGTAHTELAIEEVDVKRALPSFFYRMDSPTGDGLNTYLVSQAVCELRPDIKVVLSGVGGDELFVGYKKVRMLSKLRAVVKLLQRSGTHTTTSWTTSPYRNFLHTLLHPLEMRTLFTESEIASLTGASPVYKDRDSIETDIIQQILRQDIENYLPNTLLRDLDVMTMAHQQEARAPFLDRELVEYAWQIPLNEKLAGRPKQLVIDAIGKNFPDVVLQKRKTGFELPVGTWLRSGFLRPMLDLLPAGKMELIRDGHLLADAVRREADSFLLGKTHYMRVWSLIALEYWYRSFTSGKSYEDWCSESWPA